MSDVSDVFLSHNSKAKPMVRHLACALKERGLKVWLDEWELVPGRPWQEALEQIIQTTKAAAVLVGQYGIGPWEEPEMRACLDQFVKRKLSVIPVLLPDAPAKPSLPLFLQAFTWVDLRGGLTEEGLDLLQWGITGTKPGGHALASTDSSVPSILMPPKILGTRTSECKIVLFASNPQGTGQLALDREVREIELKIRGAEYRDTLKLISKWAVRADDLLQALNEHSPQIVHFSGHGSTANANSEYE